MTDLNPTPNQRILVNGVLGYGNFVLGAVVIAFGLLTGAALLAWVGVAIVVAGAILVIPQEIRRRRTLPDQAPPRIRME